MRNLPTSAWSENKKRLQIGLGMKQIETETSPLTLFMQKSWRSASHREALSMTPLQRAAANSESFKPKRIASLRPRRLLPGNECGRAETARCHERTSALTPSAVEVEAGDVVAGLSIVPLALPPATELIPMAMAARGSDQEQSIKKALTESATANSSQIFVNRNCAHRA